MQFEKIYHLKRILALLKQISNDNVYLYSKNSSKGINFSTINKERTVLLDVFIQKGETITDDEKLNFPKEFSFRTGKLFFDIMDTVESGSDVNLDFEEEYLNIKIYYDDIKLKSVLNAFSEKFIGFPKTGKNLVFTVTGDKMAHALNLLSKFKNELEVKIENNNNLIIESKSPLGSTKLTMPAKITSKRKITSKESVYDYEIIKPLLRASKLSGNIEVMFNWNKNIEDNVLVAKCNFKDYNGYAKYLFTPKGALDGIS